MFIDTSGLGSVLSEADGNHQLAEELLDRSKIRLIHSAILVELVALADVRRESRRRTLDFIGSIIDDAGFTLIWLDEEDHRQALALLNARPDKHYSLCDAVSFILMRRMNLREALTTDHHVEQEGFVRLLK